MLKSIAGAALFVVCFAMNARGGFERTQLGARQEGMGFAAVAQRCDPWSLTFNPAALADGPPLSIAAYSAPSPFGLGELATAAAGFALSVPGGGAAVAVRKFGFELYREMSVSAGYGALFGPVRLGATLNIHHASIPSYGSAAAIAFDAGALLEPLPGLRWGMAAANFNAARIGRARDPLPRTFSTGLAYDPAAGATVEIDAEKSPSFGAVVKAGAEVTLSGAAAVRCGISADEISAGLGIRAGLIAVDYAFTAHAELGGTHAASVTITLR